MRFVLILAAVVAAAAAAGAFVGRVTAPAPACAAPEVQPATPASVLVPTPAPAPAPEATPEPQPEAAPEPQPEATPEPEVAPAGAGEAGVRTAVRIVSLRQREALRVARLAAAAKAVGKAMMASSTTPVKVTGSFVNSFATQVWVAAWHDAGMVPRNPVLAFAQGYLMGL